MSEAPGTPGAVRVRRATADDVDGVAGLHVRAWRSAYRGQLPDATLDGLDPAERAAMWSRAVQPGARTTLLIAERDGRLVGFAAFGPARGDDLPERTGELYALYAEPAAIGTGVGRALVIAARAGLRAAGHTTALLRVLETNARAQRFYEREGWRPDGVRETFVEAGTEVGELRYTRPLEA